MAFLDRVAKYILEHEENLRDAIIVLPGNRSGLFLKRALAKHSNSSLWLPKICGIDEFVCSFSDEKSSDRLEEVFELFLIYKQIVDKEERLETFLSYAPHILGDFDDIDRYMVSSEDLYRNLEDIKKLEDWDIDNWSFGRELGARQKEFAQLWSKFPLLYQRLNESLLLNGKSRKGLIYKTTAQRIDSIANTFQGSVYFCGLNALSKSETLIIEGFVKSGKAQCLWDYQTDLIKDHVHESHFFLRENIRKLSNSDFGGTNRWASETSIHHAPNFTTQAQIAAQLLDTDEDEQTAIILCNERLLEPLKNHLPAFKTAPNITTELPLSETPVFSFIESVIHINLKTKRSRSSHIYYKDFLRIVQNPLYKLLQPLQSSAEELVKYLHTKNVVSINLEDTNWIQPEELKLLKDIFHFESLAGAVINRALALLQELFSRTENRIEKEQVYHLFELFARLKEIQIDHGDVISGESLLALIRSLLGEYSLSFRGEPHTGLQIMGMLETRSLNFKKVIFIGANEGSLPSTRPLNSFIPNDLRRYFGLPLQKNREAIHAYYFYRQLWGAEEVHIIYNADSSGHDPKEISRYVRQIELENPGTKLSHNTYEMTFEHSVSAISIDGKNEDLRNRLEALCLSGLSASAINCYINSPLDFLHKYVLRIHEQEEIEEDIQGNTFGSIVHNVLEQFYKEKVNRILLKEDFNNFEQAVQTLVDEQMSEKFHKSLLNSGRIRIAHKSCCTYAIRIIKEDLALVRSGVELIIKGIEQKLEMTLPDRVQDLSIKLKGSIDRIDSINGNVRLIDYKSSVDDSKYDKGPTEVFSGTKYSYFLQLYLYAMLYRNESKSSRFTPYLMDLRKGGSLKGLRTTINEEVIDQFELELYQFLGSMLSVENNFKELESTDFATLVSYPQ